MYFCYSDVVCLSNMNEFAVFAKVVTAEAFPKLSSNTKPHILSLV